MKCLLNQRYALRAFLPLAALLFSTTALAQDQGLLYRISLDSGSSDFSSYDIATDTWTTLTAFPSSAQMATAPDGRLFGWNTSDNEIQQYDPGTDTWSFVQAAPPVSSSYGNLEYRANGEWVYTNSLSSTLHYTVAGAWQTFTLPFQPNAIGDYDPASDTLVVGQYGTNFFHAIDMGTLTITAFTTDAGSNGERSRCGQIRDGRFYYQTDDSPLRYLDLSDNSAAPTDVANLFGFYDSCAVSENENVLFGGTLNGVSLTSVDLGTTSVTPLTGHTSVGNHSSLTWVAPYAVDFIDVARFRVTKTFSDGSDDEVEVTLTCNSGLPLEQSFTIEGGGDGVLFVVEEIPEAGADCEVTETGGPSGYTPVFNGGAGCAWEGVTTGGFICTITNEANPAEFTVTKEWVIEGAVRDEVIEEAQVTINCTSDILSIDGYEISEPDGSVWVDLSGEVDSVTVTVDTTLGSTSCSAYESIYQTGVESEDNCGSRSIAAGGSSSCTITNTVFFEGIPTLSQYGMALMALLMLGLGFVGLRRFV